MRAQVCSGCGTHLAWGLLRCPRCRAVAPLFAGRVKENTNMPRITVTDGPSNVGAVPGEVGYIGPASVTPAAREAADELSRLGQELEAEAEPEPESEPEPEAEPEPVAAAPRKPRARKTTQGVHE